MSAKAGIAAITSAAPLLLFAMPAQAYIDPVTGTLVVQGIVAAVLAVVASVRKVRDKLLGLLFGKRAKGANQESDGND